MGAPTPGKELEQWLGLARSAAFRHEKSDPWLASIRFVLDAISAAAQDIEAGGARREAALRFLLNIRKPSLEFIRESRFLFESKYLKKEEFREALVDGMYAVSVGSSVYDWNLEGCADIGTLLLTGSPRVASSAHVKSCPGVNAYRTQDTLPPSQRSLYLRCW